MNILMISYGEYEYDGRLRELHKISKLLGNTFLVSRGNAPIDDQHFTINSSYIKFISRTIKCGKKLKNVDAIFLDNRKSIIPGLRLCEILKCRSVILDCRELYLFKYAKGIASKLGCLIERRGIKKANVIICANKERAVFMKEYYKLANEPVVYQNLRSLVFSSQKSKAVSENKFKNAVLPNEYGIISTAGCDLSRLTYKMVDNITKVTHPCRLFLVGTFLEKEKQIIERLCANKGIDNVEIVGRLSQDDLKALIGCCHVGIVSYHQLDINNKYCASGKIYEFIYEGMPVVTTTNPSLLNFCKKYGVGECSDAFYDSINRVIDNYNFYQKNVKQYSETHCIEDNNSSVAEKLKEVLFCE